MPSIPGLWKRFQFHILTDNNKRLLKKSYAFSIKLIKRLKKLRTIIQVKPSYNTESYTEFVVIFYQPL